MTTRGKPLLAALWLGLVGVVVILSWDNEPRYGGRSLSQWLHTPARAPTPENFGLSPEAITTIRTMGTNTLPTALRWLSYEPSTLRQEARPLAHHVAQHFWPPFLSRDYRLAIDAETVFYVLGPSAKPAIPQLARMAMDAKSEARVGRCARALAAIGPEALSALATIIDNPQTKDRAYVIERLTDLADPAVPILVKSLRDPERAVAAMASTVLGFTHPTNSTVIPALLTNLQSTNAWRRCDAAAALARFGHDARPAIPALLKLVCDSDADVRSQASLSLHQIQPETFTNEPPNW